MKMISSFFSSFSFCLLFLLSICGAVPSKLQFRVGDRYQYFLEGGVDARGQNVASGDISGGALSQLNSTMVIECTQFDGKDTYTFIMNLFGTQVAVGQDQNLLHFSSSKEDKKFVSDFDCNDPDSLGCDVFFTQKDTGEIVKIYYNTQDSPYFLQVKLSAINALQTLIVKPKETVVAVQQDPIGVHKSVFLGVDQSDHLHVQKTFDQNDFTSFSDKTLSSHNVVINGKTHTTVHSSGFIFNSSVEQISLFVNAQHFSAKKNVGGGSSGFDSHFRSHGKVTLQYLGQTALSQLNRKWNRFVKTALEEGNLFELATKIINQRKLSFVDVQTELEKALKIDSAKSFLRLRKIGKYLLENPDEISSLESFFLQSRNNSKYVQKLFFLLNVVGTQEAQQILIKEGLTADSSMKQLALFSASFFKSPSPKLIKSICHIIEEKGPLSSHALLSLGSVLNRGVQTKLFKKSKAQDLLLKYNDLFDQRVVEIAMKNFGENILEKDLLNVPMESDFPYNKSVTPSVSLGGEVLGANFGAELFLGTNFDCNHPNFNYEALAQATADVSLFMEKKNAFTAKAVYGRKGPQTLSNEILVSVFGRTLYERKIPSLNCAEHTQKIAHTSPGFSIEHTLWVSIVPVTFKLSVDLVLDLSWGWEICDSDLRAMVELIPEGKLVFGASAEVDLLIIKAGIDIAADFDLQVKPQAYIKGSLCSIGVDVIEEDKSLSASLEIFYETKKCKFWIFDCHWGQNHRHTLWSWEAPSKSKVLAEKEWKIPVPHH